MTQIIRQFALLRESRVWADVDAKGDGVTGGLYSVEATYNGRSRTWHPHLHVIIECPELVLKRWVYAVQAAWKKTTGDSWVVNLKPCGGWAYRRRRGRLVRVPNGSLRDQRRAVRETVKYVTKAVSFCDEPELVGELLTAFQGVRRVQSFGSFFDPELPEEEGSSTHESRALKCQCGQCQPDQWRELGSVPEREVTVLPDGRVQLALFGTGPPVIQRIEEDEWFSPEQYDELRRERVLYEDVLMVLSVPSVESAQLVLQ
jgi:hypothetical protein